MSEAWLFGGSLAAILALAAIARLLKLGESRLVDAETAARFAEETLSGFEAGPALVSVDKSAALVAGVGAVAVLKRHGASVVARRLIPPLRLSSAVEGVAVETGERLFGAVTLPGVTEAEVREVEAAARSAGIGAVVTLH